MEPTTLVRSITATPEIQTKPVIPRHHLETVRKAILDALVPFAGFGAAWEWQEGADFEKRLANRVNLPAVIFKWTVFDGGHLKVLPRALYWSNLESTLYFDPKLSGTTTATQVGYLVDDTKVFDNFLTKVRVGDIAAKVTDVTGGVREVARTSITEVDAANRRVKVANGSLFPVGTRYEIHWPLDVGMIYNTSRIANLSLDMYADPQAVYGSGKTIEEIDRKVRSWWQTHISSITLQLHECEVLEEYKSVNLSGLVGGTIKSGLNRVRGEVTMLVGELTQVPWPSIESIQTTGRATPHGEIAAYYEKVVQVTEDDSRTVTEGRKP